MYTMNSKTPLRLSRLAFSMVELLVVICLIAMLAVASLPALTSLNRSGLVTQTATSVASQLEQAREYAVAQNTYVWVGFYQDTTNLKMSMVIAASNDGTDLTESTPDLGLIPNASVSLIHRVETFKQVELKEAGDTSLRSLFDQPPNPASNMENALCSNGMAFSVKIPGSTSTSPVRFTRMLQFTPNGGVRNQTGRAINLVEFGLQSKVAAQDKSSRNVVVVRINGFTGMTQVYRP